MKTRIGILVLTFMIMLGMFPLCDQTAKADYDMPYYIVCDLTNQIITIYSTADDSIVRQMLTSSGKNDSTPTGTYTLPERVRSAERKEWYYFAGYNLYGHYATRIYKGIMFHSLPYYAKRESAICEEEWSKLGYPDSHGCFRLRPDDAEFIAKNCLAGTKCKIYRSEEVDMDLRYLLLDSSYTGENGMTYQQFLGIPDEPGVLGRYSSGDEVTDLQYRLRALGYYTEEITGEYRVATVTAIKSIQRDLGLEQDGVATMALQEIIYSADAPVAMEVDLSEGMSGPAVRALQNNMAALQIYEGDIDGIYDIDVIQSVQLFQETYGYSIDGLATAEIQKAIYYEANKLKALFVTSDGYDCSIEYQPIDMAVIDSKASIRLREAPNTDCDVLDNLKKGTSVFVLEKGESWSQVMYSGKIGYIKNSYLDFGSYNIVRLRYSAVDSDKVYTIGNSIEDYRSGADFPSTVFAAYLAADGSLDNYEGICDYVTIATNDDNIALNLRSNPNDSADVITQIANGTQLKVLLESAKWTLVSYEGQQGYLLNDYLEFWSGPEDLLEEDETEIPDETDEADDIYDSPSTATVYADGNADVFDAAADDAERIGYLPHGTKVGIVRFEGDWCLIDYQGHQGYMSADSLQFDLVGEE